MRKIKLLIGVAAIMLATVIPSQSQVAEGLKQVLAGILGSTNLVIAPFFERKMTGNADKAGLIGAYNLSDNASLITGFAHQWVPNGNPADASTFTISGGLQLKIKIAPLANFGLTNEFLTPIAAVVVGTPLNGDNSGNLMNAERVGAEIGLYSHKFKEHQLILGVGGFYGNQTGTGPKFDGNWVGGNIFAGWDF